MTLRHLAGCHLDCVKAIQDYVYGGWKDTPKTKLRDIHESAAKSMGFDQIKEIQEAEWKEALGMRYMVWEDKFGHSFYFPETGYLNTAKSREDLEAILKNLQDNI